MYTLLVLIIGVFIGWNLPQPSWAKALQDRVLRAIRAATNSSGKAP